MPRKIVDTLSSWEEAGIGVTNRSYCRIIPACIGGLSGKKGIPNILRPEVAFYRNNVLLFPIEEQRAPVDADQS